MVVDPFSLTGLMIILIILAFMHKISAFLLKILFVALVVVFLAILFFGITWSQVFEWVVNVVLWSW